MGSLFGFVGGGVWIERRGDSLTVIGVDRVNESRNLYVMRSSENLRDLF
jgi:hypothetical protein